MRNLLAADFHRLWKNKMFWAFVLGLAVISGAMVFTEYRTLLAQPSYETMLENVLFQILPEMGIISAVFVTLFVGTEYSDGTIRNKVGAGHHRRSIYLSLSIVCSAASVIMMLSSVIVMFAAGIPALGRSLLSWRDIFCLELCGLLICISYTVLYTFVIFMIGNKASAVAAGLLLSLALLFTASYIINRLNEPEMAVKYTVVNEYGMPLETEEYPNPLYIKGAVRTGLEFVRDFLPMGQAIQISNIEYERPLWYPPLSLLFMAVFTAGGLAAFSKKDLK